MAQTDPARVAEWLQVPAAATDPALVDVCAAVDQWAATAVPYVAACLARDPTTYPSDVALGLIMLAARTYRRRGRPDGVIDGADVAAVYLPGRDRDVDPLLRLDRYRIPVIG